MVKVDIFEISLNSDVYVAGQFVEGFVRMRVVEPVKTRGVRLEADGRAHTEWTETRTTTSSNGRGGTTTHHHTDTYQATEVYVGVQIALWTPRSQSDNDMHIQPGTYDLPFRFLLPPNCPSSFEGAHGYIRYTCKAVIDRPWRFDKKCKLAFTVNSILDLNHEPDAGRPIIDMKSKQLGCWCCVSGNLECTVNIPRSGFVSGEPMPVMLEVRNNSSNYVERVKAKFVENVVFTAKHGWSTHTKMSTRVLAELEEGMVGPGDAQKWFDKQIIIPPVAPTIRTCQIISGSYELQIKVVPEGCHSSLKLFFPILIGNVPLRIVYQSMQPTAPAIEPVLPTAPLPSYADEYPDLPPPTYEDAVFGAKSIRDADDDEHTSGPDSFLPRYPYYKWLSTTKPAITEYSLINQN